MNLALVGVGPHSKRIYLSYLKKHNINLQLVVELKSKELDTKKCLEDNGFLNTQIFTIDDVYKDVEELPLYLYNNLLVKCQELKITHLIISTEPKAHFMYIKFCLKNNINVLTDKPITVNKNMTSLSSIKKIRKQYYEILKLEENSTAYCKVMCQRQYHRGYELIKEELSKVVEKFQVPITNIEIHHSDGAWEMPHDLGKENHPYKYGYGKLFHSGYHFIDLLSDFIKINDLLGGTKKIVDGDVYSSVCTPNDEMNFLTIEDYKRIFQKQEIPNYYNENSNPIFYKYGEKDYHGLLNFYNKDGFLITTASLNLLHNGVSRRSWIETRDFYKSNGRIRHERIDITVGHLLNIQVHSYQSKEICDRTLDEEKVGGLEHFDIYFFNNPVIDKVPFREIHLGDMYSDDEKVEFKGYNELSREIFLNNFLKGKECKGDIKDQALAIEIMYACAKGIYNHYENIRSVEKINVRNNYTYRYIANRLKKYASYEQEDVEKNDIKSNVCYRDIYTFYNFLRYVPNKRKYEVFISIDDSKDVAGGLLLKVFNSKSIALLYYYLLNYIITHKTINDIEKLIENNN